jgi:hypothetical protein
MIAFVIYTRWVRDLEHQSSISPYICLHLFYIQHSTLYFFVSTAQCKTCQVQMLWIILHCVLYIIMRCVYSLMMVLHGSKRLLFNCEVQMCISLAFVIFYLSVHGTSNIKYKLNVTKQITLHYRLHTDQKTIFLYFLIFIAWKNISNTNCHLKTSVFYTSNNSYFIMRSSW